MINLIRNELRKIASKKGIYIYLAIISVIGIASTLGDKIWGDSLSTKIDESFIQLLESTLDSYDLTNDNELSNYISDRILIDTSTLQLDYDYESPEYYYIDNVIKPLISNVYNQEYLYKNEVNTEVAKKALEEAKKKLDNYDWKEQILEERQIVLAQITELNNALLLDKDNSQLKTELQLLQIQLECLEYRIEKNIPLAYEDKSWGIESYSETAAMYLSSVTDEELIVTHAQLYQKRYNEKMFKIFEFNVKNDRYSNKYQLADNLEFEFNCVDGFIIIGMIIICGGLVAEEFNKGTIKQLLLKPFTRNKVLVSKVIAGLIATSLMAIVYYSVNIICLCIEYENVSGLFTTVPIFNHVTGNVMEINVFLHCVYAILMTLPAYLIVFAVMLFVGILTASTAAAMCSGFFLLFGGTFIAAILPDIYLVYLPTYSWDMTYFMYGGIHENQYASLPLFLTINIVTILFFVIGEFILFNKKDIKNQ